MAVRNQRLLDCLRSHAARLCQVIGAIANIMTGVLLANGRFHWIAPPLVIAVIASLLSGVLEGTSTAERRRSPLAAGKSAGRGKGAKARRSTPSPAIMRQGGAE